MTDRGHRCCLALLFGLLWVGCVNAGASEAGGGASPGASGGANGPSTNAAAPEAYWSWDTHQTWTVTDEGGYATEAFRYSFWTFDPSGYAYVGQPTPDLEGMKCSGPATDDDGKSSCVPFTKSGNTIVVELPKPMTLTLGTSTGSPARNELRAIPSLGGVQLNASYKSYACIIQSCSQAEISFTSDGRYRFAQANLFRGRLGDAFTTAAGLASSSGTYVVGAQSITFTTDGGEKRSFFFFRDPTSKSDVIQIADTWFLVKGS